MSKAYSEYLELQEQLRIFIREGAEDTQDADNIRDEMDFLWKRVTRHERAELNKNIKWPKKEK